MSENTNLFELASRQKLRFPSIRGELTTEDLWSLPLTSKNGFNLDAVAREVNGQLKAVTEESFVETRTNPEKKIHELQLEIVKHIIAVRIAENEATQKRVELKQKRDRLLDLLAQKEEQQLMGKSVEEIRAELDALEKGL